MVLFGVMGDDVVELFNPFKLREQHGGLGGIHGIDENGLAGAFNEIGVVAGTIRKRDEGVEKPPVPVNGAYPEYPLHNLFRVHIYPLY